jgi:pimeloyl-ACP methyl ester carboxylesterase
MNAHPPPDLPAAHITPYDRLTWPPDAVERLLASGENERDLLAYFGAPAYAELAALARGVEPQRINAEDRVYVLPGMMGSLLGLRRAPPLPDDVLWVDPVDFELGRLVALRVTPESRIVALGVLLTDYMKLRLRLRTAGFDVVFHDYDWRLGIEELAAAFAHRVRADRARRISIVGHSMGGLVARAALALEGMHRIGRLVMLGTPQGGSFASVQAFRGTYPLVRRIAALDHAHTAEQLSEQVFTSFPSLYQLLPAVGPGCARDLFDAAAWPPGPRLDPELLSRARTARNALAPADERFAVIAGTGEETVTGLDWEPQQFRYRSTYAGDGTVPLALASIEGVPTRYAAGVRHGDLARDDGVVDAVCDLIVSGRTNALAASPPAHAPGGRSLTDEELRRTLLTKVDWASLTALERAAFLDSLSAPADQAPGA